LDQFVVVLNVVCLLRSLLTGQVLGSGLAVSHDVGAAEGVREDDRPDPPQPRQLGPEHRIRSVAAVQPAMYERDCPFASETVLFFHFFFVFTVFIYLWIFLLMFFSQVDDWILFFAHSVALKNVLLDYQHLILAATSQVQQINDLVEGLEKKYLAFRKKYYADTTNPFKVGDENALFHLYFFIFFFPFPRFLG
jgi:hypothetical protein